MNAVEIPERLRTANFPRNPPRNPRTAPQLFYEDEKERVRSQYPNYMYKDVKDEVSRRWRALRDKSEYKRLAQLDRTRYYEEMRIIAENRNPGRVNPDRVNPGRVNADRSNLNHRTAYSLFEADFRHDVNEAFPMMTLDETNMYLRTLWENASPDVRSEYTRRSQPDERILNLREIERSLDDMIDQLNPFGSLDDAFVWRQPRRQQVPPHMVAMLLKTPAEERECPICRETIETDMYLTPCYHLFHSACVERCDKCPICREKL